MSFRGDKYLWSQNKDNPKYPSNFKTSLEGKSLEEILQPLDLSVDEFIRVCDRFTNKKIFRKNDSGELIKDANGNLEKLNYDNQ